MAVALDSEFPGLADALRRATADQQRAAALAAARMALLRTGIRDYRLDAAQAAASAERFGDSPEREALVALTDELDEAAWRIQERYHREVGTEADYLRAFRNARASSALFSALADNPFEAAVNGVYEAYHSIGDAAALSGLLGSILQPPAPG